MRGRISDWKDDRGFGFIEPELGGERVFFHISGVVRGAPRPSVGDLVRYEMTASADGKAKATRVQPTGLAAASSAFFSRRVVLSLLAVLVFPALWLLAKQGAVPRPVALAFCAMSFLVFVMYGLDKRAATLGTQRTAEGTLQLFALCCGWPGALLAQQLFRHKSAKRSFQATFWAVVFVNCGALWFALSPTGASIIQRLLPEW